MNLIRRKIFFLSLIFVSSYNSFSQSKLSKIEVYYYANKKEKVLSSLLIIDSNIYIHKRNDIIVLGKDHILYELLNKDSIDFIFRNQLKACQDGYEHNLIIKFFYNTFNIEEIFIYSFSSPADCKNKNSEAYLKKIDMELVKWW